MKEIKGNSHGGNLYLASKKFGIKEEDFLDYSANINPLGVPKQLEELIKNNIQNLVNYPNIDYTVLTNQVADFLDISSNNVIVGNGATEIIYLALEHLKIKKALMPVPTFSEYDGACKKYNVELQYHYLKDKNDFKLNVEELKDSINKDIELIFLCNPNNPTSTLMKKSEVLEIVDFAKGPGIFVILDESFIDLTDEEEENSLSKLVEQYNNLIIVRSFTKFFGIPGLRLGCGICNESLASEITKKRLPWSINYFATLLGEMLDKNNTYIQETKKWINEEPLWFYNELKEVQGIEVFKPNTNFILVKILDERFNSVSLRDSMGRRGILIRDCSNYVNLSDIYVRFAVKDRESNSIFLEKLKEILNERG